MTDPAITQEAEDTQASPRSRALAWASGVAALAIVLVLFMHVFAPTIASDDAPPADHPQSACIACHMVTAADGNEVGR